MHTMYVLSVLQRYCKIMHFWQLGVHSNAYSHITMLPSVSWQPWGQKVHDHFFCKKWLILGGTCTCINLNLPCTPNLWPTTNILLSTINICLTSFTIRFIFFHYGQKYIIHCTCKIKLISHVHNANTLLSFQRTLFYFSKNFIDRVLKVQADSKNHYL